MISLRFVQLLVASRKRLKTCTIPHLYYHIVDLFDNSGVCTKLYADDVKIYLEITNDSDSVTLQDGINKIYAWSNEWQLRLANDCTSC